MGCFPETQIDPFFDPKWIRVSTTEHSLMATPPFSNPTNQGATWTWTSGPRNLLKQILFHPPDCDCLILTPLLFTIFILEDDKF